MYYESHSSVRFSSVHRVHNPVHAVWFDCLVRFRFFSQYDQIHSDGAAGLAGLVGLVRLIWLARLSSTIAVAPDKGWPGRSFLKPGWQGECWFRNQAGQGDQAGEGWGGPRTKAPGGLGPPRLFGLM